MTTEQQSIHDRIMSARRATGDGRDFVKATRQLSPATRGWLRPLLYCGATIAILGGVGFGVWQFPVFAETAAQVTGTQGTGKPKTTPQPAPRPAQMPTSQSTAAQAGASDGDPFTTHAAEAGAKTCAAVYAGLGKAMTDGTQFMVQSQAGKTDPDHHALQGLVGMTFRGSQDGGYAGPAAGLVFAAPVAQGCEGTMVRVVPFQQSCQTASVLLPKGSHPVQALSGLPVFALPGGGQAMLLSSGQGCVAISIVRAG